MDKPTGVRPEAICPPTHRSPIQDPRWNCSQTTSIPQAAFCSYYGVKPNDKPDLRARYRTPPREMWFKDPLKQTTANPEHVTLTNGKSYCWVTRRADHFSVQKTDPVLGAPAHFCGNHYGACKGGQYVKNINLFKITGFPKAPRLLRYH